MQMCVVPAAWWLLHGTILVTMSEAALVRDQQKLLRQMPWSPKEKEPTESAVKAPKEPNKSAGSEEYASGEIGPHPLGIRSWVLPVVSSVDAFVVGVALGLGGRSLNFWEVVLIALVNGLCTILAGLAGKTSDGTWLAAILAIGVGTFFLCFGSLEIFSWFQKQESYLFQMARSWWLLAIPLSIDNCLSGALGGKGEVDVFVLGLATVFLGFIFLWFGLWLGKFLGNHGFPLDGRLLVGFVFIIVGLLEVVPHLHLIVTRGRAHDLANALLQRSPFQV